MKSTRSRGLFALVAMATLAGCGGSSGSPADGGDAATTEGGGGADGAVACTATGGTGQLVLAVSGLEAGVVPMVQLLGGDLVTPMVLTVGTPVTLSARGGYSIEWRRVKTAPATGSLVGKAFYASASTFNGCVQKDVTTTATLTYTQEPGSEKLWMSLVNPPPPGETRVLSAFNGTDITASGVKSPSVSKSKNFTGRAGAGAVDFDGNLWVPGGDVINKYPMLALGASDETKPPVVLTQPATSSAKFAAFDSDGNLWVTRGAPAADYSVVRYTAADMAVSGSPTPGVVLKSPTLVNPGGLAFDKFGDLWVTSEGNDKIVKFGAGRLSASYNGAPDVVLAAKTAHTGVPVIDAPYTHPIPLAFDKDGNLWVGFIGNIVKFTVAQQAATAEIAGPLQVDVPAGTGAFAFDESGGLWMDAGGASKFQRIPASALAAGGAVVTDIVIQSNEIGGAESLVLNPAPTWSPIHDWL